LAVQQVVPGTFLKLINPDSSTLRTYAVQDSHGSLSVVLDNLGGPVVVALRLPHRDYRFASQTTLQTTAQLGLAATSGITLGGQQINSSGVLSPPRYQPVKLGSASATIPVSAHTAVILRIR
jgi:hypothetical protein